MTNPPLQTSMTYLNPPQRGVEVEDTGAQESGSDDEHFSDASEGRRSSLSRNVSGADSPIPRTRVDRVEDSPLYGEVPGTDAYEKRKADAVPDAVFNVSVSSQSPISGVEDAREKRRPPSPIPETLLTKVITLPDHGPSSHPRAHRRSPSDALPDTTEVVQDAAGVRCALTTTEPTIPITQQGPMLTSGGENKGVYSRDNDAFGDEFDDFEEGEGDADNDFGDFDDGFEETTNDILPLITAPIAPILELDQISSLSEFLNATKDSFDTLFPQTKDLSSLPPLESISDSSAIFTSDRSLSLWSQLVAPPPLQPPNWVKSRIRRLFLVSLGVPVDLDEILPASKQKKLVLPSINFDESGKSSSDLSRSLSRLKKEGNNANASSTSVNSTGSRTKPSGRRRGPPPPPELDLSAVRRLCATTDAALGGFTDGELQAHVTALEETTARASEILEYWLQRRDGLMSEKEAFEGVIENLVNHARRVRK